MRRNAGGAEATTTERWHWLPRGRFPRGPNSVSLDRREGRYGDRPLRYPTDELTASERARLAPHVTESRPAGVRAGQPAGDRQGRAVRALLALPGHAAAAVPRRVRGLAAGRARGVRRRGEGSRAADLYERIFVGYGDDSVAQLGGAHVACEWVSNVLTKVLQRPRLGAYLEQSTRYIAYDAPMPGGGYRYYRDAALGPEYEAAMDELFGVYAESLPRVSAPGSRRRSRAPTASRRPRAAAPIKAKALDLLRGLLPAASLSHMGIYAHRPDLRAAHPAPDRAPAARGAPLRLDDPRRGAGRDAELRLARRAPRARRRVGRPTSSAASEAAERWVARLGLDRAAPTPRTRGPSVRLLHVDGDEELLLAALLFESRATDEETTPQPRCAPCPTAERAAAAGRPRAASVATAATGRAAASRRCATASRSCPTTARSATCSATGC